MATGKCPKCEKTVVHAKIEALDIKGPFGRENWKGVSYQCPSCSTILSVAIDPIAIKTDIVQEVLKGLGK